MASSTPTARPTLRERLALVLLQLGALGVVLAALPYKTFDLDRYFVPKELALHVAALVGALLCLSVARRLSLSLVDVLLVGYVALGIVSALFATNHWVAARSLGITISSAAAFWVARDLRRVGLAMPLLRVLAFATVIGAATALAQAYGWESQLVSLNRAPGGTFGNRNFMAHLAAIGVPLLILVTLEARGTLGVLAGSLGMMALAAALVLSRTRAAWLALICAGPVLVWGAWRIRRSFPGTARATRVGILAVCAAVGVIVALVLPNTLNWRSDNPYLETMTGVVNYKEGSGAGRLVQYRNSADMALHHPLLGVGPGNWAVAYPRYASHDDPSLDGDTGMTQNPWPSSDWVAVLSEHGLPALALLGLVMFGLLVNAWRQTRTARGALGIMRGAALAAVVIITAVEGAFDAVLLLPMAALVAWAAFGALAEPAGRQWTVELSPGERRWWLAGVAAAALLLAGKSAAQIQSMALYSGSSRLTTIERAAAWDPGSYRIRMRLAEDYASRGSCRGVKAQAGAAHDLFPAAPAPRRLLASCGVRVKR